MRRAAGHDRDTYHLILLLLLPGVELLLEAVNTAKHLLAGALSAVTTRTCCAPLERVKMECILQQQTGSGLRVAWGICKSEGLLGLWRGNGKGPARGCCMRQLAGSIPWRQLLLRLALLTAGVQWACRAQHLAYCPAQGERASSRMANSSVALTRGGLPVMSIPGGMVN
jgi:hypothetical protein